MSAVRVVITGRVQGVSYRAWTVRTATALKLRGWVRNRRDGSVEAVFSGSQEIIDTMLNHCKKGPMLARVDGVDVHEWNDVVEDEPFSEKETV